MNKAIHVRMTSPWHDGEVAIQRHVGAADLMQSMSSRIFRKHIDDDLKEFLENLTFIAAATVDQNGDPWSTLFVGREGFLLCPEKTVLELLSNLGKDDPAAHGLEHGDAIGFAGIDLNNGKQNRINGIICRSDFDVLDISVQQIFDSSAQYIDWKDTYFDREPWIDAKERAETIEYLDKRSIALIQKTRIVFIASFIDSDSGRHADATHRSGKPGFIHVDEDGLITIPDYAGNQYFNTLGNIFSNPRCGLMFFDNANGDVLQLSGEAEVVLSGPEIERFPRAQRLVRFKPLLMVFRPGALSLRLASIV